MASSVPVGEPVHESARVPLGVTTTERTAQHIRTAVDAELASAISRLQEAQQHEARNLKISIDGMVPMADVEAVETDGAGVDAAALDRALSQPRAVRRAVRDLQGPAQFRRTKSLDLSDFEKKE